MFSNLVEAFIYQSQNSKNGITFIDVDSNLYISYKEFFVQVKRLLIYLNKLGIKRGDKLILQLNKPYEFLISFWAGILGGIIIVPVPLGNNNEAANRIEHIQNLIKDCFIITNKNIDKLVEKLFRLDDHCKKIVVDFEEIRKKTDNPEVKFLNIGKDDIAFIQFSSGSTSLPKGIMNSHKNVITNCNSMSIAGVAAKSDVFMSWLPLTHNMGLITMHILPLIEGISQVIMPTEMFLRNPIDWLIKLSQYKVTVTASPNFAFKLCIQQLLNKGISENINLGNLRLIINGAEDVSSRICSKFIHILEKYNIRKNCIAPSYGLAEACLGVSMGFLGDSVNMLSLNRSKIRFGSKVEISNSMNGFEVVSVGRPLENVQVRIVDNNGMQLAEDYLGCIQIKGDNVTLGYYNDFKKTIEAITSDGWFNTGDLGFFDDGFLYITGRYKEMILVNGVNYYLNDIERVAVNSKSNIIDKCAAVEAYSSVTKTKKLIIFVIIKSHTEKFDFGIVANTIIETVKTNIGIDVAEIIQVAGFPITVSGKVQRFVLKNGYENNTLKYINKFENNKKSVYIEDLDNNKLLSKMEKYIINQIYIVTGKRNNDLDTPFSELGISSIEMEQLYAKFQDYLGVKLDISVIWSYPTIRQLAAYFSKKINNIDKVCDDEKKIASTVEYDDVAIIGMGCRFPGEANTPYDYWQNLINMKDCITDISNTRKKLLKISGSKYKCGYISNIDMFDAEFFSISPMEAQKMDPQQRILLMVTYNAINSAGISLEELKRSNCGVFIGVSSNDYSHILKMNGCDTDIYTSTGNSFAIAANRLSYFFNLTGPSMTIDTACSSSLVALHYACNSIRNGECNMAIVGGVNLILLDEITKAFDLAGMLSKDFKCKTFDESADGYVRGEGCGVIILKKVKYAVSDGNNIISIIRGSAINQDGKSNGLTAPNALSQISVMKSALRRAGVRPDEVSYIETHGTGTKLGDPIEVNSLNEVYGLGRKCDNPCYIGSVKTNIGHLEGAAGIASIIKVAILLSENKIPPILNFKSINKYINMNNDAIKIATSKELKEQHGQIKYAAVSSFGFGGTNAHVILQQYNKRNCKIPKNNYNFSCKSYWIYGNEGNMIKETKKQVEVNNIHVVLKGRESEKNYTKAEKIVGKVWAEELGFKEINIYKNFYELGGDSISALKIINRINGIFKSSINISSIFNYQTIFKFAQFLSKDKSIEITSIYSIKQSKPKEWYPLSSAQKRLFILSKSNKISTSYNMPFKIVIKGNLNIKKVEAAFKKLVDLHEAFRTSFHIKNGEPIQIIHSKDNINLNVKYSNAKEKDIQSFINKFVKPFDLESAPLLRVALLDINKNKHVIIIDMHHIISDGTSMGILLRDFIDLYNDKKISKSRLDYKDFVIWQQDFEKTECKKNQEKYWIENLSNGFKALNLPTDFKREEEECYKGEIFEFNLEEEFTDKIKKFCIENTSTEFIVLLSCYYILLSKYSGQEDIIIGSPISGRDSEDLQNIVGMFVNMLSLRAKPSANKVYKLFLQEVKNMAIDAYKNQDFQFDELVEKLNIKREIGRNPIFDAVFALHNMNMPSINDNDVKVELYNLDNTAKFDITMEAMEVNKQIKFSIKYKVNLFKKDTIENLAKDYKNILKTIVENPNIVISEIKINQTYNLLKSVSLDEIEFDF